VFTGIIEGVGEVSSVRAEGDGEFARIEVQVGDLGVGVKLGDSVAVNGACLTVASLQGERLAFDAVRETLARTNIGELEAGSRVNLERAMPASGRMDGHIVQGHVDATGQVERLTRQGDDVQFFVACPEEFAELLVEKGSVAIDGVSLTVVGVESKGFDVALIPHTLRETNLGAREPGERVNLEADILGKYMRRYLERMLPTLSGDKSAR
jgi:riboflavin synthase